MKKRACACVCQKKVVPLQPVFELRRKQTPPRPSPQGEGEQLRVRIENWEIGK